MVTRWLALVSVAVVMLVVAPQAADAQPAVFTELGTISDVSADYTVADLSVSPSISGSTITWYRFNLGTATGAAGPFFDIDLFATSAATTLDTEIGLYDDSGNLIASDDDDSHSLRSALTFGNTTPRTMPPDPFGFTNGLAANGRDGNLAVGTYWLAVGQFNVTFNATNWSVTSSATGAGDTVQVNFRTDAEVPVELMGFSVE